MLPEKPVGKVFFVGVQVVEHHVGIRWSASSEYNDLSESGQLFDKLLAKWPHSDSCLNHIIFTEMVPPPSIGKFSLSGQLDEV